MPTKPDCYALGSTTNKELQQQSEEMALHHKLIKQEKFRESNSGATSRDASSGRKRESLKPSGAQMTTPSTLQASKQFTHSLSHHTDSALSHRCSNEADRLSPKAARVSLQSVSQTAREHSWSPDAKEKVVYEKNGVGVADSAENYGGLKSTVQQQQQQPRLGAKIVPLSTKSEGTIPKFPVLRPISSSVQKAVVKKESNEQMPPDQKNNEDKMKCPSDDLYQGDDDDVIITEVEPGKRRKKDDLRAVLLVEGK